MPALKKTTARPGGAAAHKIAQARERFSQSLGDLKTPDNFEMRERELESWVMEASFLHHSLQSPVRDKCRFRVSWNFPSDGILAHFHQFLQAWMSAMGTLVRFEKVPDEDLKPGVRISANEGSYHFVLDGPGSRMIAGIESGYWMIERSTGEIGLVILTQHVDMPDGQISGKVLRQIRDVAPGMDLRTGMEITPTIPTSHVRQMILSQIPIPTHGWEHEHVD
ncbi:MAG: hypothetical protein LR011_04405 [Verrucomicrobia bacterium]|nr:hypothetical protein [Verrucomicrobiota bacterium]